MSADEPVAGVPRRCARQTDCTRPRGHDGDCGPDRDQARVARYAAALSSARLDAVLAVADTELAEARAEVERLTTIVGKVNDYADTMVRGKSLWMALDLRTITAGMRVVLDPAALDAVEPADQPTEDPVVTEAKRRCAEYRASLPAGVSTEATWQDWAPGGFYYEPADQPHPTPEADQR